MINRKKLGIIVAEFFGTALLTSTVLAQGHAIGAILNKPFFVTAVAGLTLSLLVITVGRVSGAHVNPAVTIGLWTLRKIETTTAVVYIGAQILGAAVALSLYQYFQDDVLVNVAGKFDWHIFVAEAIGTFVFAFGIAAVVTQKLDGYKAAFGIGASLMLGAIVAATLSNGILNPAVALGLNSWSWTYVAAPILGSVLGMNVYDLFLAPESDLIATEDKVLGVTKKSKKAVAKKNNR